MGTEKYIAVLKSKISLIRKICCSRNRVSLVRHSVKIIVNDHNDGIRNLCTSKI